ncbi:16S rRNA (guanine(527)-N(7))-methyltransferase RsmG [Caldicellulosiruptoraceae bacterium PP1]
MINEIVRFYGIKNEDLVTELLKRYMQLVLEKNKEINLTSITDENEFIIKHFADSLSLLKYIELELEGKEKVKAIDIGTGAGFPGVAIKIAEPRISLTLVDSIRKKCDFLSDAIYRIGLSSIEVICSRAEDLSKKENYREKYDIAFARAVARLNELVEYTIPFVNIGGIFLAQKGSQADEEIEEAKNAIEILGAKIEKVEKLTLPNSNEQRSIIVIRKFRQTPTKYPRKTNQIVKNPIK